jgi:tetratricopeptide (TPR) repeat protein
MPAVALTARLRRWYWNQAAAWCVLFRRRDVALEYYERMLAQDPRDVVALASVGYQQAQLGRKSEALATFDRLVAIAPADAEAHFNRGFLLQERNDHARAIAAFRSALANNADHDRALYGLALSLIATGHPEDAIAPLKRNTALQPMSPYGWYQLARVQHELGRSGETQAILDHLATFEPDVARQLERETGLAAAPLH